MFAKIARKGAGLLFVFAFLATAFIGVTFESSASQPVFKTLNLSNDGNNATDPFVWNVGSHVYVAWTEASHGVFFRESPDNGTTWAPPLTSSALKISPKGGVAQYPILTTTGNYLYAVWSQTVNNTLQVFFVVSTNSGASFSPAVQLTSGSSVNGFITPVIAAAGSNVYVAYTANGKNSYVVWSNDNGGSWSGPFHYATTHEPQIAAIGNNAYAIADGVQIAVTNNAGGTWTIVNNSTNNGDEPWVVASGSYVYVASQTKTSNGIVHFFYSNNYGKVGSWTSEPGVAISSSLIDAWAPMMWAYGNNVWIGYHTYPGGNASLEYIQTSHDNGLTFGAPIVLSNPKTAVGFPFTVWSSDGQNVWDAWPQEIGTTGNYVFRVAYSTDSGNTWTAPPGLNASLNSVGQASNQNDVATGALSAFGQTVFVTYQYTPTSGVTQVYFSTATIPSGTTTTTNPTSTTTTSKTKLSLIATPNPTQAGTNFALTGAGFPVNTNITIQWGPSVPWPNHFVVTNSSGGFSIVLETPTTSTFSGSHTLATYNGATEIIQIQVTIT